MAHTPLLVALAGLPGVGKSVLARRLSVALGACWIRIDTIEQTLRARGWSADAIGATGYDLGGALAADQLRVGRDVVADSVNPVAASRDAWRQVARDVGAGFVEVEVVCADPRVHRQRVEQRIADIRGHVLPTWSAVMAHEYTPWPADGLRVDTADGPERALADLLAHVEAARPG